MLDYLVRFPMSVRVALLLPTRRAAKPSTRAQRPERLLSILALILGLSVGCKPSGPVETPSPPTAAAPAKTEVTAPTGDYQAVAKHLDVGGRLLVYLNTDQWATELNGKVAEVRDAVLAIPSLSSNDRTNLTRVFALVSNLLRHSGLESVNGVGLSGLEVEPGFYRTRLMVHRRPGQDAGYVWSLLGQAPHRLEGLEFLPADTAVASFFDLDLAGVWQAIRQEVKAAGVSEAEEGLSQLSAGLQQGTGSSLEQMLASLAGEHGVVLTLDESRKVAVPLPNGTTVDLPDPGLLLVFKVKDDRLFDFLDGELAKNPGVISEERDGARLRTLPVPLPIPLTLRPTVVRSGEYLMLASSDALAHRVLEIKAGKQPGLRATAEFQRLARGVPTEGNQLGFVSERFTTTLRQVQSAVMNLNTGAEGEFGRLLNRLLNSGPPPRTYSVSALLPDGWLSVANGNQEPAKSMITAMAVVPVSVLAGVTVPALAKAKDRAKSITCVNNLKQIGLAARMYASDHEDRFPPDLLTLKSYLGGYARVLVCPEDTSKVVPSDLTWDKVTASLISYELVSPGIKDDGSDPRRVLARCTVHGHVCHVDGSVEQRPGGP